MIRRRTLVQAAAATFATAAFARETGSRKPSRGHWRQRPRLPLAVQEIYPALAGDNIHVAGGITGLRDGRLTATDTHVTLSIASNNWRALRPLPHVRHHLALAAVGETIYAVGGFTPVDAGDWAMRAQTWRYDAGDDRWRDAPPAPEAHAESVTLAPGDTLHIIGGRAPRGQANASWQDHVDSNRHLAFDTTDASWHRLAPPQLARNSAAGAVIDGLLYVVGGRTVTGGNVALLEVYDPGEDRWRTAAPMPQAQGGLAAAAADGCLVACGGEFFGPRGNGVYAQTWCYEPAADAWHALAPMPTPRHGLGAVSDGSTLFALGGATQPGAAGTSAVMDALRLAD